MKNPKLGVRNAAHPVVVPWDEDAGLLVESLAGSDNSGSVVYDALDHEARRKACCLSVPRNPSRIASVRANEKS